MGQAFKLACEAGIAPGAFWQQTPYETRVAVEGMATLRRDAYARTVFGAWHGEGFARTKRLPKLAKVMKGFEQRKPNRNMSPEEIWSTFKMHNAALGGRDESAQ